MAIITDHLRPRSSNRTKAAAAAAATITSPAAMTEPQSKISARDFYGEYYGHRVQHLKQLLPLLRSTTATATATTSSATTTASSPNPIASTSQESCIIWTAGDSSLDNKYWFSDTAPAIGAYADLLQPPRSKQDVTYWLNRTLQDRQQALTQKQIGPRTNAINAAVEATTLNERTFKLRPQDEFLRDNIQPQDILVVSVGGNDVALSPLPCTVCAIGGLLCCLPAACMEYGCTVATVPADDCCCGCGPSLCSCAAACPPCLGYLRHMFGTRCQNYIQALTAKTKPAKILVCMIYYPDENTSPSWAGPALGALGYNQNPAKLQTLIRKAHVEAVCRIRIPGSTVISVPLYHVLDGKNTDDYVQRVEPSPAGGRKMAEFLLDLMEQHVEENQGVASHYGSIATSAAPLSPFMQGRG